MRRRYATVDVFTSRRFGGNPLAVVLDASGLSGAQMQVLAAEFNYSETTFVLPPRDPSHTAHVRIFTTEHEVPFAGHPNVGTAFVLGRLAEAHGGPPPDSFVFEEAAGPVPIELLREDGAVVGAEITAPEPLSRRDTVTAVKAARCLGLEAADVLTSAHQPQVVSVGLPFLVVELASRGALRRISPSPAAHDDVLPLSGANAVYAYTRDAAEDGTDLQARMFMSRMTAEDPATGSATAAVAALLAGVRGEDVVLHVGQGVDMGRPSLLRARGERDGAAVRGIVGGGCVGVFEGEFTLEGEAA